jgi:beta-aspartyl-peptidase (threonine type)
LLLCAKYEFEEMKQLILTAWCLFFLTNLSIAQDATMPSIVVHGGAGTMAPGLLTDSLEREIRQTLDRATDEGYNIMKRGGSAVDAVEAAIVLLENSPLFNAGRGAVMTQTGQHTLDASIMDGNGRGAGAVASVTTVKNPIKAARAVMLHSPHVLLAGEGAEAFAKDQNLKIVDNSYFTTPGIKARWMGSKHKSGSLNQAPNEVEKFGTVGAVAIDKEGNIAAGTSTGGMMNKRYGRIGDSPIIGAGTYADNATCGVSCTGHGEYFIRLGVAKEISDQMTFGNKTLDQAAKHTLHERLEGMGGSGGLIAIDHLGNIVMEFNTPGMYRAYRNGNESKVEIYGGK